MEVFLSMKISQGKLSRARLEFLGKKKREEKITTWEIVWPPVVVMTLYMSSLGAEVTCSVCLPIYLPLQFLWALSEVFCGVNHSPFSSKRFLVSTIEARVPVGIKQDMNLNSPFPLLSKQVGHLVIIPVMDMDPNVPLDFFTFKNTFIQCWSKSQLWNRTFPPVPEINSLYSCLLLKCIIHQVNPPWNRM